MTGIKGMNGPNYKEFCEVAEPLMKWLAENVHPHSQVVVTSTSAQLWEGIFVHNTNKFLKD